MNQRIAWTAAALAASVLLLGACEIGGAPPPSGTISTITCISAGSYHSAELLLDGTLRTWGDNEYYQLGDGWDVNQTRPIEIPAPGPHRHWVQVSAGGFHTIAIAREDSDRYLYGWGLNLSGQAGFWWKDDPVQTPTQIGNDTDWEVVSAGYYHSAAIKEDGTLWTWGANSYGELGFAGSSKISPTKIGEEDNWTFVSAGTDYTLGLLGSTLYAWGRNVWGQLGDGTQDKRSTPVEISSGWRQVCAGYTFSVGVKDDGTLWAWGGYGTYVYLGNGGTSGSLSPVQIGTDSDWALAQVKYKHVLAVKQDGSLWSWGESASGALGLGKELESLEKKQPTEVQPGTHWTLVCPGQEFSLGIKGGALHSWGDNGYGQLGIGSHEDMFEPEDL